jgi:hypothetical protein
MPTSTPVIFEFYVSDQPPERFDLQYDELSKELTLSYDDTKSNRRVEIR